MTIFLAILGVAIAVGIGLFFYMRAKKKDAQSPVIIQNIAPPPPKRDNSWEGIFKDATRDVLEIGTDRLDKLANQT